MRQTWHECACGETNPNNFAGRQKSRCKKCQGNINEVNRVARREKAIAYKGGKCSRCGYDKCRGALEFHHRDPTVKEDRGLRLVNWGRLQTELDKCDLLCANCHREIHNNWSVAQLVRALV